MSEKKTKYYAVDLFSGCGGLSQGLCEAGFKVLAAIEIDQNASFCYKLNHEKTKIINRDIRKVTSTEIKHIMGTRSIDLLAACPPCQGFSAIRRLNRKRSKKDKRNNLIIHFLRFVRRLKPSTIMMENVPALKNYYLFHHLKKTLISMGYEIDYKVVNLSKYGIAQRRRRLVLVGSRLGPLKVAPPTYEFKTVRDVIGNIGAVKNSNDKLHHIVAVHTPSIRKLISLIPKNGGSRSALPKKYQLNCHKKTNIGFNDIYGRLKWDDVSPTITGGCLNPSKGRFLHPVKNRALTAREAALLQSFPKNYKFPTNISRTNIGILIGNALPPKFSRIQSMNIIRHLQGH
ncbi:MAG: DNA cytosine methyltransferase [Bacteroidota bacterium]